MKTSIPWKSIGIIVILGVIVYANSLGGAFIWDDEYLVKDNSYIKSWANVSRVFTEDIGASVGHRFNFYRPLQMLSYMLDHSLWKLDVRGYHLTSISFHILAALAIFWLIAILANDTRLALLGGALFVIHPVHTEAVSYISSRADPMFLFFLLMTVILYIKNLDSKRLSIYLCMAASYVCALLSKEMSLILPVLLLLYHYAFNKKLAYREVLTLVVLAGLYVCLRMTVFDFSMEGHIISTTLAQRLPGFFVAIAEYFRLMVWPFDLHMEYGSPLFQFSHPKAIAGIVIFILSLIYVIIKRKEKGLVFFGLAWFFLAILPVSNLYPINATMAEHWLYLPAFGLFFIAAHGLNELYKKRNVGDYFLPGVIGIVIYYLINKIQK